MNNNNIFVIFYLLLNFKEVVLSASEKWTDLCDRCSQCPVYINHIELPTYVVVFIGILLFLMIITIIGLVYMIIKLRKSKEEYGNKKWTVPTTTITEYAPQTSNCNSDAISLVQTNNFNGSYNKNESTLTIFDDADIEMKVFKKEEVVAPKVTEEVNNQPVIKNGKMVPVQHIISPDMMKELCTGVLKKIKRNERASLTELDKLQNECVLSNEKLINSSEGDASLPDLEDYDSVPRPIPVNNENGDECVEEVYYGVYDSPESKDDWNKMKGYKMPKPSEETYFNSYYINAREPIS